MLSRLTAMMLALMMGVPLCWCCTGALPVAAATEGDSCATCRYHEAEGTPAAPMDDTHGERRCCAKFNLRTLSPDVAGAPRLILVDLQAWVWSAHEAPLPTWVESKMPLAPRAPPDPLRGPPLYQQHCALLL